MQKEFKCDCGCSSLKIGYFKKDKSLWIQLYSLKNKRKHLGEVVLVCEDISKFKDFVRGIDV